MTDRSLAETLTQLIAAARSAANGAVSAAVFNVWADVLESAKWQVERAAAARVGERPAHSQDWIDDCNEWRGRLLTGRYGHWCADYDELPVDESCPEWPCPCNVGDEYKALRALDPDSQTCSYPGCAGGHNAPLAVDGPRLAEQMPVYGAASPVSAPRPPREEK